MNTTRKKKLPPGPRDWFFGVPQGLRIQADALHYYTELAQRYGDIAFFRAGPYRIHVVFHPDQIHEVLLTKAKSFEKMPKVRRVLSQLTGNGLVLSEGDFWQRQRRLGQAAFQPKRFEQYSRVMVERTLRLVERWDSAAGAPGSLDVDADRAMTDLAMEILAKTLFDVDIPAETAELGRAVALMSELFFKEISSLFVLPDWLPLPGKRRKRLAIRYLDETIRRFIGERRASGLDRGDVLSMLLLAVDHAGDGGGMTDEQARNEALTLLVAGHDSTAAGLTWVCYGLARNPGVAARATAEVDTVLGGRVPEYADVARLCYLEAVCKEAMRLYAPPFGVFTRRALADVEIGGYSVEKGSLVQMVCYLTQRDQRWFPDPGEFDPDRFAPGRIEQIRPYAYFPFGAGPRACLGSTFAMTEMILVTATILQRFELALAPGQQVVGLSGLSFRPKGGLRLRWTRRRG
jgi:cytochrome P450